MKKACNVCRQRKKKCDGGQPHCSYCLKVSQKNKTPIECTYSSGRGLRASNQILSRLETVQGGTGLFGEMMVTPLSSSIPSSGHAIQFHSQQSAFPQDGSNYFDMFTPVSYVSSPQRSAVSLNSPQFQPPTVFPHEELDFHLIQLSNLYFTGYSIDEFMLHTSPAERAFKGNYVSMNLLKAISFHSVFISNHPRLFDGNENPTFQDRLNVAKLYRLNFDSENLFSGNGQNNQELCDEIRAMLLHALSLFSIGQKVDAYTLNATALIKAKFSKFFESTTYWDSPSVTADNFMAFLNDEKESNLSFIERQDRIGVLATCLLTDTFCAVSQGSDFMIDETKVPNFPFPKFPNSPPPELKRKGYANLGRNSIWDNGIFGSMYDDILEARNQLYTLPHFRDVSSNMKTLRRIIRFARSDKSIISPEEVARITESFHGEILTTIQDVPSFLLPIPSLQEFAPENLKIPKMPGTLGRVSNELLQYLLVALSMISYLHLPNVEDQVARFRLTPGSSKLYTSKEMLFVSARVMEYLCDLSYTPISPGNSVFRDYPYPPGFAERAFSNPPDLNLASPLLFEATSALMLYLIGSTSLLAARTPPINLNQLNHVHNIMEITLLPCLTRISSIWPVADGFKAKLAQHLGGKTDCPFFPV